MIVIILERVPASVRGELTRWLLEPKTGVFVGRVSGMVRDRLWSKVCDSTGIGSAVLVHSTNNEQGYALRYHGEPRKTIVDFEGLSLIRTPS